jgi:uncharacterized membrane protein
MFERKLKYPMNPAPNTANPTFSLRRELLLVVVLILPFIALAVIWSSLPERVPMHFDAHGNVNRYGSPFELLILPGMNVLVAIILYFIPRLDPNRANIVASMPAYFWIRFSIATLLSYVFAITLDRSFNPDLDVLPFITIGVLGLFFALGFAMPKLKQNYMIGIRLPWTLESEDNWNRTHAFAGKLWMRGSLVGIVLALIFQSASFFIALGTVITMMIWTGVYSYRLFQKEKTAKS